FDSNPGWSNAQAEIFRQGYAWVGVSAQFVGVYGREGALVPFNLKSYDPERYAALEHPGDSFSFDIFSQVAQAARHPGTLDLLDGLEAQRIIATGQSQSASRLVTYVNAIQPRYQAYDGILIHSRSAYAAPLAEGPQVLIESPEDTLIRTDLSVPVLVLQAENDVLRSSVRVRQDDSNLLRIWEVAGTAHSDLYSTQTGWQDDGTDPSAAAVEEVDNIQGFIQCDAPVNSGPMHYAYAAALDGMNRWIIDKEAPANGEPLQLNDDLSGFLLDDTGNALGGIRTPFVDAPVALLSGQGQSNQSFCALFGTTRLLSSEQLASVYTDESGYVAAVSEATDSAVAAGYLLSDDGELIIAWASEQWRILMARAD
ncbi:MAG: alpha/beta hydrolase domain-containing protein, partial [Halioglobus sp.]